MTDRPGPARAWALAARPKTLPAAIAPVAIGTALAAGEDAAHAVAALGCLAGALCIQIGTNFWNDWSDWHRGADTSTRQGPARAVASGWIAPASMRRAAAAVFAAAALAAVLLALRGGWPLLALGAMSILCGILYTSGPYPLAYVGLGDVFVLAFFGLAAVCGTFYVQALFPPPGYVWLAALPPGLLSVGLLAVNNLRDVDGDRAAGKRTLAVRFGRTFARAQYTACVVLALAIPAALALAIPGRRGAALSLLLAPVAAPVVRRVWRETLGAGLNPALGGTARLLVLQAVLFLFGWNL